MQKELDKLCCKSHILYRNKAELPQLFLNTLNRKTDGRQLLQHTGKYISLILVF